MENTELFVMSAFFSWNKTCFGHLAQAMNLKLDCSVLNMVKRCVPAAHDLWNIHKIVLNCAHNWTPVYPPADDVDLLIRFQYF